MRRIAVYTDYAYSRHAGTVYADRAFALFLAALAERLDGMVVVGRLRPDGGETRYPLPDTVKFVALPHYESLARPGAVARSMVSSMREFWRALDDVEGCWLLGPHPLALGFAGIARVRHRQVVLGVRQDLVAYVRTRHRGRPAFRLAAAVLDGIYRGLSRRWSVVVVGPALRHLYRHARRLLEIAVSLVPERDLAGAASVERDYSEPLRILSVGRIDEEKNPLMLAEVLARLHAAEPGRWRLIVCGEGPLLERLSDRLLELGLADVAELRGYVQHGAPMRRLYESSHMLLHVSWTEGLPQVIIEALAARLPTVATDVGGIGEAVGEAALLIDPGAVDSAERALRRIADDPDRRRSLMDAGTSYARDHTLEAEIEKVAAFLDAVG